MPNEDLATVANVVIDEVHRTTPVRLAFRDAAWYDDGADERNGNVYGVVHLRDQEPDEDPEGPLGPAVDRTQAIVTWDDDLGHPVASEQVLVDIANSVSDIVQVELWHRGLDYSWPPCPEHDGRHPLRPVAEPQGEVVAAGQTVPIRATWRCYQPIVRDDCYQDSYGPTAITIGRLCVRDGVSEEID